jgi:hypothetical protein
VTAAAARAAPAHARIVPSAAAGRKVGEQPLLGLRQSLQSRAQSAMGFAS